MNCHRPIAVTILVTVAIVTSLSGCGASKAGPENTDFQTNIKTSIEQARSGGASDEQMALLEQISSDGKVSIETARVAARSYVACMTKSGYYAEYVEEPNASGLVQPGYRVRLSDGDDENALTAAMDTCYALEDHWVDTLYQTQPTSAQQRDEYMNALMPQMRKCLTDAGYPVDDGATATELQVQIAKVESETNTDLRCFTGG